MLQAALCKLQVSHPILRSKLIQTNNPSSFTFSISPSPFLQIQSVDLPTTSNLLHTLSSSTPFEIPPFHLLLEHELNQNPWSETPNPSEFDVLFASIYSLPDSNHVITLRLHTSVCDRTSAVALLKELLGLIRGREMEGRDGVSLPVEELVPKGKGDKPFWLRGVDLVGYSLNSLRLSNLGFEDVCSSRCSQVARLQLNRDETHRLLAGCKKREIKLCGALVAAGLIAANSCMNLTNKHSENYAVATLIDCRNILDPVLHDHNLDHETGNGKDEGKVPEANQAWEDSEVLGLYVLEMEFNVYIYFTWMYL